AARHRRTGRDRPDREDVEVAAQHRRPRRHHRQLRRRHRALVHAFRFAPRTRCDLDRGGGAGRLALRATTLAPRARASAHPAARAAAVRPPPPRFGGPALALRKAAHRALARVSEDIERLRFNVCVAHIYEFANAFQASLAGLETEPMADYRWAVREAADILVR